MVGPGAVEWGPSFRLGQVVNSIDTQGWQLHTVSVSCPKLHNNKGNQWEWSILFHFSHHEVFPNPATQPVQLSQCNNHPAPASASLSVILG